VILILLNTKASFGLTESDLSLDTQSAGLVHLVCRNYGWVRARSVI